MWKNFTTRPYTRNPSSPELLESDTSRQAVSKLQQLMNQNISVPTQQVAGMTDTEKAGQSQLADLVAGKSFQNPNTSQYYSGLRDEIDQNAQDSLSQLNRSTSSGGMLRSSGAARARADLAAKTNATKNSVLGQRYDQERNRDNEYTRVAAANQYGGLERTIQNQKNDAQYAKELTDTLAPYEYQSPIAQLLAEYGNYWMPQYDQQASGLENLTSILSGIVSPALQLMFPGRFGGKTSAGSSSAMYGSSAISGGSGILGSVLGGLAMRPA